MSEATNYAKRIRVRNTCETEFHIFILLGDDLFRLCLKVNAFCFILKDLFYNHIMKYTTFLSSQAKFNYAQH